MIKPKKKISNQLFRKFYLFIGFIILIAVAGLICIQVLNNTSSEIVFEYNELNSVHSLKNSFNESILPAFNYLIFQDKNELEKFKQKIGEAKKQVKLCNELLHSSHNKELLVYFDEYINRFDHIVSHIGAFSFNVLNHKELVGELELLLDEANKSIETLLLETKKEIDEHIITNQTSAQHSSITIVLLTLAITLIGAVQVYLFVRKLIVPLNQLVASTNAFGEGDFSAKTNILTNNELELLGNAFNKMVNNLERSTVSVNYLNDILASMYESLIVTNSEGIITMVNKATCNLLGYTENQLIKKHICILLFSEQDSAIEFNFEELKKIGSISNVERRYHTIKSESIPVLFSCTFLRNQEKNYEGVLFVAHDIRERKRMYKELNNIHKRRLIDINEAQEKERLRIAGDIHDGLGQILTSISYYVENNILGSDCNSEKMSIHANTINELINKAIRESKTIAFDLIPILLKDFGLVVAVENLFDQLNAQNKTQFKVQTFNIKKRFDEKLEKVLYRVVQEASNNILKHAETKKAFVQIIGHKNSLSLVIIDEGKGFDYRTKVKESKNRGIGLISMKERIESYNGVFSIDSELGRGTEILIEIPIN